MVTLKKAEDLQFTSPASYRINVKGFLDESWSDRLSGMLIENHASETRLPTVVLRGRLLDQTQLLGILRNLYEMHLPLISVELLEND